MEDSERLRRIRDAVYIEPDEVFLWTGKPAIFRLIRRQFISELNREGSNFGFAFLLLFGAVVLLALSPFEGLENITIGGIAIPVSLILLLVLVFSALAYFGYKYWRASQIIYAITNQRALVIDQTLDGNQVRAYNNMSELKRRNLSNGRGDLVFAQEMYTKRGKVFTTNKYWREIGFIGIENVAEVETLLRKTFPGKT